MKVEGIDDDTVFEDFLVLSGVQQKIFDRVKTEWEKQLEEGKKTGKYLPGDRVSDGFLKRIIIMGDVHGDGVKRVSLFGSKKIHLVPIDEIILNGLKGWDLDKYPVEE